VDRVVSLSPDVATALRQGHGLQAAAADEVCPSRMTRKGGLPLGARPIRTRLSRSLPLARITTRSSPHSRRHPFATQRLHAGASREVGKALLGHRSLQMTLRYPPRYDRTKRAQDDPAMAQVEQHQSVHRRSSRDDIRQTALDRLRASLERRQCSAHPVVSSTLARRLCFAEVAVPLAQVSFREVEQCVERQPHLGRAWATINRRRNALQHCFALGVEPQLVRGNPVQPRHFVRRGPPLPQALSREPVQRRFAQIAQPMERALFLVLLRGGRRGSAVAALTLEQIDGEQQAWHIVQGTGRKARRVSMSPEAVTRVPQCLEQPPGARAQGAVFWNRQRIQQPRSVTAIHKKMAR
jgi:site-specific recombinase XerD